MPLLGGVGSSCSHCSAAGAAGPVSLCRTLPFLSCAPLLCPVPVQDLGGSGFGCQGLTPERCCPQGAAEPRL